MRWMVAVLAALTLSACGAGDLGGLRLQQLELQRELASLEELMALRDEAAKARRRKSWDLTHDGGDPEQLKIVRAEVESDDAQHMEDFKRQLALKSRLQATEAEIAALGEKP